MYMQDGVQSQVRHLLQNYFMDFIIPSLDYLKN